MIHPSKRWQFVQPLDDRGFFEDEVVRHLEMGHQAMRRSFTEKVWQDRAAVKEIERQAQLAVQCNAPALPRVYMFEIVKDCGTIIMEHVDGKKLPELIKEGAFKEEKEWAAFAMQLASELLEVREQNGRFSGLAAEHIVVVDSTDIRITQRWVIGDVDAQTLKESAFLQRMALFENGGVYVSDEPDEEQELLALREILIKMAVGSMKATYETARKTVVDNPTMHKSHLAGADTEIAKVICGLDPEIRDVSRIRNLQEFHGTAERLYRAASERRILAEEEAKGDSASASGHNSPRSSGSFYVPPRTNIVKLGGTSEAKTLYTGTSKAAEKPDGKKAPAKKPLQLQGPTNTVDLVAPVKKDIVSTGKSRGPSFDFSKLVKPLLIAVAVIAVLAAGYVGIQFLMTGDNQPPMARLEPPVNTTVSLNGTVVLDASRSTDPENDVLSYQWELANEGSATVFFSTPRSSDVRENVFSGPVPMVQVQFMSSGQATIRLRVFDGLRYSDPQTVTFDVRPE